MVLKQLKIDQKGIRKNKCLHFLGSIANEQDYSRRLSEEWHTANSPRPKKAGMSMLDKYVLEKEPFF